VKDRIYARMLTRAERRAKLMPGMSVIECTNRNAGSRGAAVSAIKVIRVVIVMPEG
jgi:cysteine synthase